MSFLSCVRGVGSIGELAVRILISPLGEALPLPLPPLLPRLSLLFPPLALGSILALVTEAGVRETIFLSLGRFGPVSGTPASLSSINCLDYLSL